MAEFRFEIDSIICIDNLNSANNQAAAAPSPMARVLVVAETGAAWELRQAIEAGVHGYLPHSATPAQLLTAV
jgi:DNA-binding NarL/FixJ family response regulator